MAVTITIAELRAALRLNDSTEETAEVTRLLAYASAAVVKHAPNAPDVAHNEATRRLSGYLFDQPEAGRGDGYANALRSSGAARMLLVYREHRAGYLVDTPRSDVSPSHFLTFVGNATVTAQIAAVWYATSIQAPATAYIGISINGPLPTDGIAIFPNTLIGDGPVIPGSAATLGDKGHTFSVDAGGRLAMAPRQAGVYEVAVYSLAGNNAR